MKYFCVRVFCIVCICFLSLFLATSQAFAKSALTLLPAKETQKTKTSPLRCEPKETEKGLQAMIRFAGPPAKKDEPPGGNWQVFLNDFMLGSASFEGTRLDTTLDIPTAFLRNGRHTLRCELHSSSGEHIAERSFLFDGSPTLTLTAPTIDKNGLLDATVSFRFFGSGDEGVIGLLDVLIDEQPVAQARLTDKQTKAIPLSRLLDKPVTVSHLPTGTHLLTLRAVGINGAATVDRASFTVQTLPQLVVSTDKHSKKVLAAQARFLPVTAGYAGRVEVFCDQDLLLSRGSEKETVVITREELLELLKKRDRLDLSRPITLVFALRAMNGTEHWQAVEFVP